MIKLFVFSLLASVVALYVSLYLGFPADPGYLLIAFGNNTFETSLFALLVALGVIYIVLRVILLLLQGLSPWHLVHAGKAFSAWKRAKARSKTVEGLLHLVRGSWQSSYNLLMQGRKDRDATVVNLLAAAIAAFKLGQRDTWMNCLEQAEAEFPTARSTIGSLKAQLFQAAGQLEQSLAVLEQIRKKGLNDNILLTRLKNLLIELEDWGRLEELLPQLEKNKVVAKDEAELIRRRIFMERLYRSSSDSAALGELWKQAPAVYKLDEKIVRHYVDLLVDLHETETVGKVLETAIAKVRSKELIWRFGYYDLKNNRRRLITAESWLKNAPGDTALLLCVARLCMQNKLWGRAKEYLETALSTEPTAEIYGELSRLSKALGDNVASEEYLEKCRELLGVKLPPLPLPLLIEDDSRALA